MTGRVLAGVDNLQAVDGLLRGRRVGLMSNQTGVDRRLRPTAERLGERCRVTALFAAEHGLLGSLPAGDAVPPAEPQAGIPVYSCYGASRHLPEAAMDRFDVFVFDMQDVGARFYTYLASLSNALKDCARAGKTAVVLDRPNPLGGILVQGTLLEEAFQSFVGPHPMPTRYGLSIGEYALWVRERLGLNLELHIAPLAGWRRGMLQEDTGLLFVPPSPNCATLQAVRVYTGTCVFEGTNLSEGRGTALPFELIGAPFVDAARLEGRMNALGLPGFVFRRAYFTPGHGKHAGALCAGVQVHLTDPHTANPFAAGLHLLEALQQMHPEQLVFPGGEGNGPPMLDKLLGTADFRLGRLDAQGLIRRHAPRVAAWREESRRHWLYPE